MTGFPAEVVAAAFDAAALPAVTPLQVIELATHCPACGDAYVPEATPWLGQVCYPPSADHPVAGHPFEIPAWCATERRFLDGDGPEVAP